MLFFVPHALPPLLLSLDGRVRMRLVAVGARQLGEMTSVAPVRDGHAERRPDAHIIHIVAIVFAPRDGDQGGSDEGRKTDEGAAEVAAAGVIIEDVQLAGEEEAEETEAGEGEGRVAGGKGSPAVLEGVAVGGGADGDCDEDVWFYVGGGLAAGEKVRAGAADGVFDNVCDEGGEDDGDCQGEVCCFVFVGGGAGDDIVGDEDA